MTPWHEEPINKNHDREAFDCGDDALNEFLCRYARQSHERGGAKTLLAVSDADNRTILGFYSLSPASVSYARTPEILHAGWRAMRYRASAWHDWPWIADIKARDSVDNFCSQRANAACWRRPR